MGNVAVQARGGLPGISIVTPSFNQAAYLDMTLRSVLDQHYPGLEYVVVDGGSTDGSVDIIKRHEAGLARWVSEPDKGHSDALKKGFAMTAGEVMGWINSSDFHLPWTLAVVGEIFARHPEVRWITGVPCMAGDDGVVRATYRLQVNRYDFIAGGFAIQQESTFWRRDLWDAVGGLDSSFRYAADFDLWTRFFQQTELYSVSCALGAFRWHGDRLGRAVPVDYRAEAARSMSTMLGALAGRERRRARLVGLTRRLAGRAGVSLLEVCPVSSWYRHPGISYDFNEAQWTVGMRR